MAGTLVVLLVVGWVGWNRAEGLLSNSAQAQSAGCAEGDAAIRVVVAPDLERPVSAAARTWNEAGTVVHGHCVRADVMAMPADRVLAALTGRTDPSAIGGMPAAWVPESARWQAELANAHPELIGSSGESVATSGSADYPFIGLSGDAIDAVQERAAQSFRGYLRQPGQRPAFDAAGLGPPLSR